VAGCQFVFLGEGIVSYAFIVAMMRQSVSRNVLVCNYYTGSDVWIVLEQFVCAVHWGGIWVVGSSFVCCLTLFVVVQLYVFARTFWSTERWKQQLSNNVD
jgi:hypothetical protein